MLQKRQLLPDFFYLVQIQFHNLHWELMFRQRAVDNQVYTIGAAPARDLNAGYHSWGHSIAADPWGKVLTSTNGSVYVARILLN